MLNLSKIEIGSVLALVITLCFIIANLLSNKKLSLVVFLLFIILGAFVTIKYAVPVQFNKIVAKIAKIDTFLLIANGVIMLLSVVAFVLTNNYKAYRNHLIRHGINYSDNNFVAYLSRNNRIVHISKKVAIIIKKLHEKGKQVELKHIVVNGGELKSENFEKVLIGCKGTIEEPTNLKIVYANGIVEELNLVRKPIMKDKDNIIGYVLVDNTIHVNTKVTAGEFKKNLFIYLDMLNQPLAYFDSDEAVFVVTRSFSEFLSLKNNRLTLDDLKKLIHSEDHNEFKIQDIENNKIKNVYIRLQTKVGYVWFELIAASFNNYNFIVLRKADLGRVSNINYGTYESLVNNVNHLCQDNNQFGLVMFHLVNIPEITSEYGKEVANLITNKFLTHILANILNNQVQVYRIGSIEFIMVMDKTAYLDLIVRDLANKDTELLSQEIVINKYKIKINSEIAVVYSRDIEKLDASSIIKVTFDTIKEANDPEFYKPYSIYQPKDETETDFSLEDLGIDLDIDLSEFKE